jgi:hypothetical protein
LISSFSDGLKPNQTAKDYLGRQLVRSLLQEQQSVAEQRVKQSLEASPCYCPDVLAIDDMKQIDQELEK